MFRKILILFKIGRRIARSDALDIISKIHKPPFFIKLLFKLFSISFSKEKKNDVKNNTEDQLCRSIEKMGTTFIKLGQFLSTRPDIVGEDLSIKLEKLQDKLPPFETEKAKIIIKKNLGEEQYKKIINLSKPIAAASIAQVHKAKINDNGTIKDVAIKILRPDIEKFFNEELDALMLFAYIVENTFSKAKRLEFFFCFN